MDQDHVVMVPESDTGTPDFNNLWAKARSGDEMAIVEITTLIEKRVFAVARNRVKRVGRLLAESGDVVQEVLARFWLKAARSDSVEFESRDAFNGFLDTVALRVIAAMLAARSKGATRRLSSTFDVALQDAGEPPSEAVRREKMLRLEQAIADLSDSERALLHNRLVKGMSWCVLARLTGATTVAVKKRFERLQKKVIDLIG